MSLKRSLFLEAYQGNPYKFSSVEKFVPQRQWIEMVKWWWQNNAEEFFISDVNLTFYALSEL